MQVLVENFIALGEALENLNVDTKAQWKSEAQILNKWFNEESIEQALTGIGLYLKREPLEQWIKGYAFNAKDPKIIGVVMAGNIPLVGFHDFLCVLISGNFIQMKLSSEDTVLMRNVIGLLLEINPDLSKRISIVDRLTTIDAIIATGSDNTAKHFEYYFSKIPRIIRKNRSSVAVLNGDETEEELTLLGSDMLQYFGLGCRNVSKIYVPKGYTLDKFYQSIESYKTVVDHFKYNNNYEYNRSIFLLKSITHFDNGFLLGVETKDLTSSIAVFYFEFYDSIEEVKQVLAEQSDKIQCVVSKMDVVGNTIPFGHSQKPNLWDYADGVDTLKFLESL